MKCPLCQNTFQAPALPPPVAPSPPAATEVYGVQHDAPAPPPPAQLPQESPAHKPDVPAPALAPPTPPPPVPSGDYSRVRTIWISPRVVPWIAPVSLLLALLLGIVSDWTYGSEFERGAWGWGWSETNALTLLYTLMLLFALLLSLAIISVRLVPGFTPPAALQQVWPWRAFFVAIFAFLAFTFLTLQLIVGFIPKDEATRKFMQEHHARIATTIYVWIVWYLQLIALVGSLLEYWLDVRGPGKPIPRIDIHS
jgi:hypothetical protein